MLALEENNTKRTCCEHWAFDDKAEPLDSNARCKICLEDMAVEQDLHTLACGHTWHHACIAKHVSTRIHDGQVLHLTCPSCPTEIDIAHIERLATVEEAVRYKAMLFKAKVDSDPTLRWCPTPDCGNVLSNKPAGGCWRLLRCAVCWFLLPVACGGAAMTLARALALPWASQAVAYVIAIFLALAVHVSQSRSTKGAAFAHCGHCHKTCCFGCGSAWHPGRSCEQAETGDLLCWASSRDVSRCPQCQVMIEKNGGCPHMTCQMCRHQFCWKCKGAWRGHNTAVCNRTRKVVDLIASQRKALPGPPWMLCTLALCVSLGYAMLLGYGARPNFVLLHDYIIESMVVAALVVAGGGLFVQTLLAQLGDLRSRLGAFTQHVQPCAVLFTVIVFILMLPKVPALRTVTHMPHVASIFLAVISFGYAEPAIRRSHPLYTTSKVFPKVVVFKAVAIFSPLVLAAGLTFACNRSANVAPLLVPVENVSSLADEVVDLAVSPNTTVQMEASPAPLTEETEEEVGQDLSAALRGARALCVECKRNGTFDQALVQVEEAAASLTTKYAKDIETLSELQKQMQLLADRVTALETKTPPTTTTDSSHRWWHSCFRWIRVNWAPIIACTLTFLVCIVQCALSFMMFFCGEKRDYATSRWHRALALTRGVVYSFLLMQITGASSWPAVTAGAWWGARLSIPTLLVFQCVELQLNDPLSVPLMLSLLPAVGLRSLSAAGFPSELVPLVLGGALATCLLADEFLSGRAFLFVRQHARWLGIVMAILVWYCDVSTYALAVFAGVVPSTVLLLLMAVFVAGVERNVVRTLVDLWPLPFFWRCGKKDVPVEGGEDRKLWV